MPARVSRPAGRAVALLLALTTVAACASPDDTVESSSVPVVVTVVDEDGLAVLDATFESVTGDELPLGAPVALTHSVAGNVRADGYLPEPVVLDPTDPRPTVSLWRDTAADGTPRRSIHFGGDVMLGRRYQDPVPDADTARVLDEAGAREVVRSVAPLMRAADAAFVNLETVVGELAEADAFDAKRFLLQTPPFGLAALDEMGIDLVALGNNHAYDWQDEGVVVTLGALDAAGIAHAGAGLDTATARAGRLLDVGGLGVATLSYTTVNGDFVNDQLPARDEPVPDDLAPSEAWQYELRSFGFGTAGEPTYVRRDERRIGDAWRLFEAIEDENGDTPEIAALWRALTAPGAYPELQDWVARRGHGGAAAFAADAVAEDIARQRAAGAEVVVVQLHAGFQFSEVASAALRRNSRLAIDAGADIVVAHHPHVLQGFEWYQGKLIAHSLGNFLFDQDFLATFPSAILRTVWEGDRMIEARVVPLTIDRYRPVAVSGRARDDVLHMLDARSALPASADRVETLVIGSVVDPELEPTARVWLDGTTGLIGTERPRSELTAVAPESGVIDLPPCTLVVADDTSVELGLDLFRWGAIDDDTADGLNDAGTHWVLGRGTSVVGTLDAHLELEGHPERSRRVRPIARAATPQHRWFDTAGFPLDGPARYSLDVRIRPQGTAEPHFLLVRYRVEDTDPTVDPRSEILGELDVELPPTEIGAWTRLHLDVTGMVNPSGSSRWASAVMPYLSIEPGGATVEFDDMRLMEWRTPTASTADLLVPADAVRAEPGTTVSLTVSRCTD